MIFPNESTSKEFYKVQNIKVVYGISDEKKLVYAKFALINIVFYFIADSRHRKRLPRTTAAQTDFHELITMT